MVYDANVAMMLKMGFSDGKNSWLIDGMTKSIRTISYPSSDHPRNDPATIFFCAVVKLNKLVCVEVVFSFRNPKFLAYDDCYFYGRCECICILYTVPNIDLSSICAGVVSNPRNGR
jgi:hypothetical protein